MLPRGPLVAPPGVAGPPGHHQLRVVADLGEELTGAAAPQGGGGPPLGGGPHRPVGPSDITEALRVPSHRRHPASARARPHPDLPAARFRPARAVTVRTAEPSRSTTRG